MSGYLDFTDADLIALTRQRRAEARARREIEAAHAGAKRGGPHALLTVKARKEHDQTLYFGGEKSIIAFKPTATERAIRRNTEKKAERVRRADAVERSFKYLRIYELQGGACYLCGSGFASIEEATDDHVVPKAQGGKRLGNILHACLPCNNGKSHRAPHPCEVLYMLAINLRLPRCDLRRASGRYLELPAFIPLRQRLAAEAAE